jgi:hypothetical protein
MKVLFYTIAGIFLFTSCQKDVNEPIPTVSTKVKTYTEEISNSSGVDNKETYNVSYDDRDRLSSIVSTSNPGDKFVYHYNADNSFTLEIYGSNSLVLHEIVYLTSFSLVDSTLQYDDTMDSSTEKYLYNSAKQLITLKEYDYSKATGSVLQNVHQFTYDNNGNVTQEKDLHTTTTYEYYPDLLNPGTLGELYFYQSKNLPKKTTITEPGFPSFTSTYTYTFDSYKRLTSARTVGSDGVIVVQSYTY